MSAGPRRLALPALLALASGCGMLPQSGRDGGAAIVPKGYQQAAVTGGHLAHVGAPLPDGGSLRCASCHAIAEHGFEDPGLASCADCHAARADFHHGGDAGLPDGGQVRCTACHPFVAAEGQPLTPSPWECLQCHAEPQGNKQAIEVHGAACFYCHEPHRKHFTRPTDCVACHAVGLVHGAEGETVAKSCMQCHEQHRPAAEASRECLGCHADPARQKRAAMVVTKSALFKGHGSCGACHQAHRFAAREVKACEACHKSQPVLAKGKSPKAHTRCTDCHAPHASKQAPKSCASCHKKVSSTHPVKDDLHACHSCHPPHQALPKGAVAATCESCHKEAPYTGVVHGKDDKGQPLTCAKCHPTHGFAVKKDSLVLCRDCHANAMLLAAKARKDGHAKCGDCHAGLPHQPAPAPKPCLECHKPIASDRSGHAKCAECHEAHSARVVKQCPACHELKKLPGLHAEAKHQSCKDCHSPHDPQPGPDRKVCMGSCHQAQAKHEPNAERCTGCHLFQAATNAPRTK